MRTSPPPILSALRARTTDAHRSLEEHTDSGKITSGELSLREYERLIRWQTSAHQHLEPGLAADADYASRLPALRRDLVLLQLDEPSPPPLPSEPLDDVDRIGLRYVLEGASLGGAVILKALQRTPALQHLDDFHFFAYQKEHGLPQWRTWVQGLRDRDFSDADIERATARAQWGFGVFRELWGVVE